MKRGLGVGTAMFESDLEISLVAPSIPIVSALLPFMESITLSIVDLKAECSSTPPIRDEAAGCQYGPSMPKNADQAGALKKVDVVTVCVWPEQMRCRSLCAHRLKGFI